MKSMLATLALLLPLMGFAEEEFTSVSNHPIQHHGKKCDLLPGGQFSKIRESGDQVEFSYIAPSGFRIDSLISGCSSGKYETNPVEWERMRYSADPKALEQRLEKRHAALEKRKVKAGDYVFLGPVDPALKGLPTAPCRLQPQSVEVVAITPTAYKFRTTQIGKYDECVKNMQFEMDKNQAGDWYAGEELELANKKLEKTRVTSDSATSEAAVKDDATVTGDAQ